jgi:hypothetical protein
MLVKSKRLGKITLYRQGIGYYLKLLQMMLDYGVYNELIEAFTNNKSLPNVQKEIIEYAIKTFTNIKNVKLFMIKNKKELMKILIEIINFNSPGGGRVKHNKPSGEEMSVDAIAIDLIDTFAYGGYCMTPDQIMKDIDYVTALEIKKRITERKATEIEINTATHNDSEKALEIAKIIRGIKEVESWSEV